MPDPLTLLPLVPVLGLLGGAAAGRLVPPSAVQIRETAGAIGAALGVLLATAWWVVLALATLADPRVG